MEKSGSADVKPGARGNIQDLFVEAALRLLIECPVLPTISHLQRALDPLDIEGLDELLRSEPDVVPKLNPMLEEPTINDWDAFVQQYLDPSYQANLDYSNPTTEHHRYYILSYLLSASFKDCSIVLRFPGETGKSPSVSVIDLDVKPIERLDKWRRLDRDIAASFTQFDLPRCKDAFRPSSLNNPSLEKIYAG